MLGAPNPPPRRGTSLKQQPRRSVSINLTDLLAALGLFLVLEGIAPFLNPRGVKRALARLLVVDKVSPAAKLASFEEPWQPKIVAELNDSFVKVVKLEGEFVWHHHDDEDELFLVVAGRMRMQFRDGDVVVEPGELIVVPRGVEHRPRSLSREPVVLMFEPSTTLNTGDATSALTVRELERL